MLRIEREIPIWGTEIYVSAASDKLADVEINLAIDEIELFFIQVDNELSTYKLDSFVSKLRTNRLNIEVASPLVQEVWRGCLRARDLSFGAFDPWKVIGGFDPSGYVKGWAAEKAADLLVVAGCESVQVNAAGDLALRSSANCPPWRIGVVNPDEKSQIMQVFEITNGHIATSGTSEKGAHIHDPFTDLIAIGAKSATVIGPDGGICDALATAVMVDGKDAARWIGNPELRDFTFWTINRHSDTAWSYGPNTGVNSKGIPIFK